MALRFINSSETQTVDAASDRGDFAVNVAAFDALAREKTRADYVLNSLTDTATFSEAQSVVPQGGLLKLSSGTFPPFTITTPISVRGVYKATLINSTTLNGIGIDIDISNPNFPTSLSNLYVDMNSTAGTTCIRIQNARHLFLGHLYLYRAGSYNLDVQSNYDIVIAYSSIEAITGAVGMRLGYSTSGVNNITVLNTEVYGGSTSVELYRGQGFLFYNLICESCQGSGIVSTHPGSGIPLQGITSVNPAFEANNIAVAASKYDIHLKNCNEFIIDNISAAGTDTIYSLYAEASVARLSVRGGFVSANGASVPQASIQAWDSNIYNDQANQMTLYKDDYYRLLSAMGSNTVLYLPCTELTGSSIADISGNGHTATGKTGNIGSEVVTAVEDFYSRPITQNKAVRYDFGPSGTWRLDMGDHADFTLSGAFSLICYLRTWETSAIPNILLAKWVDDGATNNKEWQWFIDTTGHVGIHLRENGNTNYIQTLADTALDGSEHVLVVTCDGTNAVTGLNLYLDGVVQASTDSTSGVYAGMSDTTVPLRTARVHSDALQVFGPHGHASNFAIINGEEWTAWEVYSISRQLLGMLRL